MLSLLEVAALITMVGIIINRLNVTVIGFKWDAAVPYVPSWMEIAVTLTVLFVEIWIFRWIITPTAGFTRITELGKISQFTLIN